MTIYSALPFVRRTGMYSVRLPNLYNVSFDYYYCLIIIMLSYIPCKSYFAVWFDVNVWEDTLNVSRCVASVSSALLPHVAAEKKGASRGSHSGEGRVNRPLSTPPSPPQAWSLAPSFPEQDKEELYRLSGNTGNTFTIPVLWALETEAEDHHGLFILLTGFNAPFQKTQLSVSPGLSPAEAVHGGLKEKSPFGFQVFGSFIPQE